MIVIKKNIFIVFIISISANAQNRTEINGQIISTNNYVANINIINATTNKGTISDINGKFSIKVAVNDVLIVTSVAFKPVRKIVTTKVVLENFIKIKMKPLINQLNEVTISNYKLSGSLANDSKNVPENFKKKNVYRLDMSGINLESPGKLNKSEDYIPPEPLKTSETVNALDFVKIGKFLTKGIRKKVREKKAYRNALVKIPNKIRNELGDSFFINTLKITKPLINDFIIYCNSKNIYSLYKQNKKIELIEILLQQSKIYLIEIKNYN